MIVGSVWIFNGEDAQFPSGVFESRAAAETWIGQHGLSGVLTEYPVGVGVYDWAVENGYFSPSRPDQKSSRFVGRFSCARQQHVHFREGVARG